MPSGASPSGVFAGMAEALAGRGPDGTYQAACHWRLGATDGWGEDRRSGAKRMAGTAQLARRVPVSRSTSRDRGDGTAFRERSGGGWDGGWTVGRHGGGAVFSRLPPLVRVVLSF